MINFIKKAILWIIASAVSVFLTQYYFPEYLIITWWISAFFISGFIFWILNSFVKPILKLLSLPFIILTAWIFTFFINWLIIFFVEYFFKAIPSLWVVFQISWWFMSYIIISIILGTLSYLTHWLVDIK